MAFEVGDRLDPEARATIGAAQGQELPLDLGACDPALAVGRDAPAADDRDDATTLGQGIGQPHEHDDPAAFARPEAGGAGVEDPHRVLGQGAGLGEADQLERVEAQVDPARQRDVQVAGGQRRAGVGHRQQRRRAGPVDGVSAPLEVEVVADPARDRVREPPGERLLAHRGERLP